MRFISSVPSSERRPIKRLIEYTVFSGFVTAWRFATCPTRRSPPLVMATTEGVVRAPSWLGITTGSPPCMTATTEFVVPRSIPMILLIDVTCPPSNLLAAAEDPAPLIGARFGNAAVGNSQYDDTIYIECIIVKKFDVLVPILHLS